MESNAGKVDVVRVQRTYTASREEIFDAFTVPEMLVQWWGPPGNVTKWAEIDLRPGGQFHIHMSGEDGSYESAIAGTYLEVSRPSRLVMEMTEHCNGAPEIFDATKLAPTIVTIDLKDLGGGQTELTLVHRGFDDPVVADAHQMGWDGALGKLPIAAAPGAVN